MTMEIRRVEMVVILHASQKPNGSVSEPLLCVSLALSDATNALLARFVLNVLLPIYLTSTDVYFQVAEIIFLRTEKLVRTGILQMEMAVLHLVRSSSDGSVQEIHHPALNVRLDATSAPIQLTALPVLQLMFH